MNLYRNDVDDISINRTYPNKNLRTILDEQNIFLKKKPAQSRYVRNTCLHNKKFNINETPSGYIGHGGGGIVKKGTYTDINGKVQKSVFKILIDNILSPLDIDELKFIIEANKITPDCVVEVKLIEKCSILNTSGLNDLLDPKNELIVLGMEEGKTTLNNLLIENMDKPHLFHQILLDACNVYDKFNEYGFFHRDSKPENIIMVDRNFGRLVPVIIDFGWVCYMNDIDSVKIGNQDLTRYKNPHLDSFYLILYIIRYYKNTHKYKYVKNILEIELLKYYCILMSLGLTPHYIYILNSTIFDTYTLNDEFLFVQNLYKSKRIDISLYTDSRMSQFVIDRIRNNRIRNLPDLPVIKNDVNLPPAILYNRVNVYKNMFTILKNELQEIVEIRDRARRPSPPRIPSSPRRPSPPRILPGAPLLNCFNRKKINGSDLSKKQAQAICKQNNLPISGNKQLICNRLRNHNPPLCL